MDIPKKKKRKGKLFIADEMLVKLARWLRIIGLNVENISGIEEDEILNLIKAKNAILLTSDKMLHKKAFSEKIEAVLVPDSSLEQQIKTVLYNSKIDIPSNPKPTICPVCNGKLKEVKKNNIKDKVPKKVYKKHKSFWECKECGKIYWKGTHWDEIKKRLKNMKKEI